VTIVMLVLPVALLACDGRHDAAGRGSLDGFVETAAALTDAGIMAILDEASRSDSVAAALAVEKATDAEVRAFAASAMEEHHALRVDASRLAKALALTPRLPASDPLGNAAEDEMIALRATPHGPAFDRVYVERQIATHLEAKEFADEAKRTTPNDQIRDYIDRVTPVLERQLARAQALHHRSAKTT
jgi:predicted outer membrane protein